jgi:pimeloyl-ACP methyl ester carboxylesterase
MGGMIVEDMVRQAPARRILATRFLQREAAPGYPACAAIAESSEFATIEAGLNAIQGWSGKAHLPNILSPTLILWHVHDPTYAVSQTELLWRSIPRSSLAVVPNCAHAVHAEHPGAFTRLVDEFLRDA